MAPFRTAVRSGRWFLKPSEEYEFGRDLYQWDSEPRVRLQYYCLSSVSSSRVLGPDKKQKGNVGRTHSP
jgi:hypothetical protein